MPDFDEIKANKRKTDKYTNELKATLGVLDTSLKEKLEPEFYESQELCIDCYSENVDAFETAPTQTIFPKIIKGYKMPNYVKHATPKNRENVLKVVKDFEKMGKLNSYLNYVTGSCDLAIYLKFFGMAKSKKLNSLILSKYNLDLNEPENKLLFKNIREKIRNGVFHNNKKSEDFFADDSNKKESIVKLQKATSFFFDESKDKTVCAELNKRYKNLSEIIEVYPIYYIDILNKYSSFENENDLINAFGMEYDDVKHYLYANTPKMVEKIANMISPKSSNIKEEIKEKVKVNANNVASIKEEINKKVIESLLTYDKNLTEKQIIEIGTNACIIIDGAVFEGNSFVKINDDKDNQNFIYSKIIKPLGDVKKYAVINHSSRIALNKKSYEASTVEEKYRAKHARDMIHYFVERGGLRYTQSTGTVYKKGVYETAKTIEANPNLRFLVVVNNMEDANLLDFAGQNVIVARVFGFGNSKELRLTNKSKIKLLNFANYRFSLSNEENIDDKDDNLQNIETLQEENIIEFPQKTSETITKTIEKDKKLSPELQKQKVQQDEKKKIKGEVLKLPSIASVKCIPDNNEALSLTFVPKEGDILTTSSGKKIVLGKCIGQGGEGVIYNVDFEIVAKIYHENRLTQNRFDKLKLMIDCKLESELICFPLDLLFNSNNEFVGYTMRKAPSNYMNIGESVLQLNNRGALETFPDLKKWDRHSLTLFCANLSDAFRQLHSKNILMGDINAGNILVDIRDNTGSKFLIVDTDSFQVGPYPCPVGTPVFTSPEIYKRTNQEHPRYGDFLRTLEDEEYALASLLFQILMLGQTPYAGKGVGGEGIEALKNYNFDYRGKTSTGADVPDGPFRMIWQNISIQVKGMFENVFTGSNLYSAEIWRNALRSYAKNIKDGKSANELKPYRYPAGAYIKEFVCERCHRNANLPQTQYEKKIKYKDLLLCKECDQAWLETMKKTMVEEVCEKCNKKFKISAYDDIRHKTKGFPRLICDTCGEKIDVPCYGCGKIIKKPRYVAMNRKHVICDTCGEKIKTNCYICGAPIEVPRYNYDNPKYNKHFRCENCRNR